MPHACRDPVWHVLKADRKAHQLQYFCLFINHSHLISNVGICSSALLGFTKDFTVPRYIILASSGCRKKIL